MKTKLYALILIASTSVWAAQGPPPSTTSEQKILARFDKDGDKKLNASERTAAREYLKDQPQRGFGGPGGPGGRGGFGGMNSEPVTPGERVTADSVATIPASLPFYDAATLRTLFLTFENADWESELTAFKETDVEVPANLAVDGKSYKDVGVKFRGMSSFMSVPEGRKRSLNISLDSFTKGQTVLGYSSLNLLNSHEDPTFLRSVLYLQAARDYMPAAKANFVRVVINGEHWGIYANVEQVNKTFLQESFKTDAGTRWKVPGSPGGRGGLEYWPDDLARYKQTFEIKTKDDPQAWDALVNLTKTLNVTPPEKLEAALSGILDVDSTLRFLALDNALVNNDGYWVRASDYNIYLDPSGKFHVIPHDVNETFGPSGGRGGPGMGGPPRGAPPRGGPPMGFGGRGGPRGGMMGGDARLDPLIGLDDASKPLRSKLLAVPKFRARYLEYVKEIATTWLDWQNLEPLVSQYQSLIAADVKVDTRKLQSFEEFQNGANTLKTFADERRAFLLNYSKSQ